MNTNIEQLKPQAVWTIFKKICSIPHSSKNEELLRDYIVNFAKENNIECELDAVGNVILRKQATPGYENRKGLIMQSHIDMVPQKNSDKDFDFLKDGIEAYVDGDWVTANGTTLGADNGMGVAAAMYIMSNNDINHGLIEALLTIDEETGMTGAFGLDAKVLKGDILLNLDSEDEGEMYVGCAGGIDLQGRIKYTLEDTPAGYVAYKMNISGLKGGHSGMEIILQRGNSAIVMFRLLNRVNDKFDMRIAKAVGGDMRNAIPREANGIFLVKESQAQEALAEMQLVLADIKNELKAVDGGLDVVIEKCDTPAQVIDMKAQNTIINVLVAIPNGINRMSDDMIGLVESSSNMGILAMTGEQFEVNFLVRGSVDSGKEEICEKITSIFRLAGADSNLSGGYNGWQPNLESPILKRIQNIYNDKFGVVPEIKGIHAGLECGILGGIYPNLDMISFGPTIRYPHSPDEKVHIASVEKFVMLLEAVVQDAPEK